MSHQQQQLLMEQYPKTLKILKNNLFPWSSVPMKSLCEYLELFLKVDNRSRLNDKAWLLSMILEDEEDCQLGLHQ